MEMNGRLIVALLVAVVFVFGCEPQRTLVPRMEPALTDIPVPLDFKLDPAQSTDFASQTSSERYSNYYYTGYAYFEDVVDFYKRRMPVEGWRLQQDVDTGGRKTLFFKKTGAGAGMEPKVEVPSCIVTIFASDQYATAVRVFRTEK
jgi:hypothetical protein